MHDPGTAPLPAMKPIGYQAFRSAPGITSRRVLRGTKFSKMFRYRCADFLYLVIEDNIFAEAEIPAGWGLLVRRSGANDIDELKLARAPADLQATAAQRVALLECIALAATRAVNRAAGVSLSPPDWTSRHSAITNSISGRIC